MAEDWIKVRKDLPHDPTVIGMAATLSVHEDLIVGKLIRLWSWADSQTIDGNAPSVTKVWVDRYVDLPGFACAMQTEGWLELHDHRISFPRFEEHFGQSAKRRALAAKRAVTHRAKSNAPSVTEALPEKRREEKTIPPPPSSSKIDLASDPWKVVVVEMIGFGVQEPQSAIDEAKANGCTPKFVLELIAFANSQPGAWGGGALRRRVANALPEQDPSDESLWMPVSNQFSQAKKQRDADQQARAEVVRQEQERNKRTEERLKLEADFGEQLDSLDDSALNQLARSAGPFVLREYKQRGVTGCRHLLLEQLAKGKH